MNIKGFNEEYMRRLLIIVLICFAMGAQAQAKCKRPRWKVIYNEDLGCKMRYNHFLMYKSSIRKPEIEKINGFCIVREGLWIVPSVVGAISLFQPVDLNIDHILPYSYIVKQVGCEKAKKYFNINYNLRIVEANFNLKKSNNICENRIICLKQKQICKTMQKEFGENLNCEKL